jgi:hypothetical protein
MNVQISWYLTLTSDADRIMGALLNALASYRGDTSGAHVWQLDADWHAKRLQISGPDYLGTDVPTNLHKFVGTIVCQMIRT